MESLPKAQSGKKKTGNRLEYTSPVTGEVVTKFRKAWDKNEDNCLDTLMTEWDKQPQDVQDSDGSDYTEETV